MLVLILLQNGYSGDLTLRLPSVEGFLEDYIAGRMFPVPPLDGSRVLMSLLPRALARQYAKLERFAFLILLGIIFLLLMLGRQIGTDLNLFR